MSTNDVVESIAEDLRNAWAKGPYEAADAQIAHFAEKFEMTHNPPSAGDGVLELDALRAGRNMELDAFMKAMPDFREEAEITVEGDKINVELTISGTLADGETLKAKIPTVYTVKDGKIVSMLATLDPEFMTKLFTALSSVGFEYPGMEG